MWSVRHWYSISTDTRRTCFHPYPLIIRKSVVGCNCLPYQASVRCMVRSLILKQDRHTNTQNLMGSIMQPVICLLYNLPVLIQIPPGSYPNTIALISQTKVQEIYTYYNILAYLLLVQTGESIRNSYQVTVVILCIFIAILLFLAPICLITCTYWNRRIKSKPKHDHQAPHCFFPVNMNK